jgi:4'-phosphopantetheinyl transferase
MGRIHTKLYLASAEVLEDSALFARLLETLPYTRQEKVRAFRNRGAARLSLAAGLLLNIALRDCGLQAGEMRTGEYGKPCFPALPDFHFSLSHSGSLALCAVSALPLGCDIEQIRGDRLRLAARFFHPQEYAWLLSLPEEERQEGFFRLWTSKESFIKAIGRGLSLPLGSFCVLPGEEPALRQTADARPWFLRSFLTGEYACALCTQTPAGDAPLVTVALDKIQLGD